jgi:hypothetical protein
LPALLLEELGALTTGWLQYRGKGTIGDTDTNALVKGLLSLLRVLVVSDAWGGAVLMALRPGLALIPAVMDALASRSSDGTASAIASAPAVTAALCFMGGDYACVHMAGRAMVRLKSGGSVNTETASILALDLDSESVSVVLDAELEEQRLLQLSNVMARCFDFFFEYFFIFEYPPYLNYSHTHQSCPGNVPPHHSLVCQARGIICGLCVYCVAESVI